MVAGETANSSASEPMPLPSVKVPATSSDISHPGRRAKVWIVLPMYLVLTSITGGAALYYRSAVNSLECGMSGVSDTVGTGRTGVYLESDGRPLAAYPITDDNPPLVVSDGNGGEATGVILRRRSGSLRLGYGLPSRSGLLIGELIVKRPAAVTVGVGSPGRYPPVRVCLGMSRGSLLKRLALSLGALALWVIATIIGLGILVIKFVRQRQLKSVHQRHLESGGHRSL